MDIHLHCPDCQAETVKQTRAIDDLLPEFLQCGTCERWQRTIALQHNGYVTVRPPTRLERVLGYIRGNIWAT